MKYFYCFPLGGGVASDYSSRRKDADPPALLRGGLRSPQRERHAPAGLKHAQVPRAAPGDPHLPEQHVYGPRERSAPGIERCILLFQWAPNSAAA